MSPDHPRIVLDKFKKEQQKKCIMEFQQFIVLILSS